MWTRSHDILHFSYFTVNCVFQRHSIIWVESSSADKWKNVLGKHEKFHGSAVDPCTLLCLKQEARREGQSPGRRSSWVEWKEQGSGAGWPDSSPQLCLPTFWVTPDKSLFFWGMINCTLLNTINIQRKHFLFIFLYFPLPYSNYIEYWGFIVTFSLYIYYLLYQQPFQ